MEDRIQLTIADGVAEVRLNRAAKMNALDPAMFQAIAEAGARLKDDRSLRAVVLSGEGRAFCAGRRRECRRYGPGGEHLAVRRARYGQ